MPWCVYLERRKGQATGAAFIDATTIAVGPNRRIHRHQVLKAIAQRGQTSMGWFYGFKRHLVMGGRGELLAFHLTPGNTVDRRPVLRLARDRYGKRFGDKTAISKHRCQARFERGLLLITPLRNNRHNRLLPLFDKCLLRKRSILETVKDQLKNISQIEHTRHRSMTHFMAGLVAYTHQPRQPSLNLTEHPLPLSG